MPNKLSADGLSASEQLPASSRNLVELLEQLAPNANAIQRGVMQAAATHIRALEADLAESMAENVVPICDEPGCSAPVAGGWPSPDGYRHTCRQHWRPIS